MSELNSNHVFNENINKMLCGNHILRGVERLTMNCYGKYFDSDAVPAILFKLDNTNFIVIKNHDNGWRSYAGDPFVTDKEPLCPFELLVFVHRIESATFCGYTFVDTNNQEIILKIGTDYSNDFYPKCVFAYHPEKMSINNR